MTDDADNVIRLEQTFPDEEYEGHIISLRINPVTKQHEAKFTFVSESTFTERGLSKDRVLYKVHMRIDRLMGKRRKRT